MLPNCGSPQGRKGSCSAEVAGNQARCWCLSWLISKWHKGQGNETARGHGDDASLIMHVCTQDAATAQWHSGCRSCGAARAGGSGLTATCVLHRVLNTGSPGLPASPQPRQRPGKSPDRHCNTTVWHRWIFGVPYTEFMWMHLKTACTLPMKNIHDKKQK